MDTEAEKLKQQRSRALDVHRSMGAVITSQYLERTQEYVAVNKNDLNDILEFDGLSALFSGFGLFLLSGAGWLLVDKALGQPTFTMTGTIGFCLACVLFGAVALGAGVVLHRRKRGRITRIFSETKSLN